MQRITLNMIERRIEAINERSGAPMNYRNGDGSIAIGHYHLSQCYGGYALHCTCNGGGAINEVSTNGHGTKRELFNFMAGFILGIDEGIKHES